MDRVLELGVGVIGQLASPSISVFWGYLLSAAAIAGVLWWRRTPPSARSWRAALAFVAPPAVWRNRSTWHDFALFVINTLVYSLLLLPTLSLISVTVGRGTWAVLLDTFGPHAWRLDGPGAVVAMTVAVVVVADFAFFVAHWLQHRFAILWAFHKVHHSATVLQPLTVLRRHPVDIVFEGAISGALLGALYGASGYLAGEVVTVHTILGTNAILFAFLLLGFNLQHSHVWWSFGPLDRVFISPAAHQIHHSTAQEHFDKNMGNMLSIWDRIAGTYVAPSARGAVTVGLGPAEDRRYRTLFRLYLVPLVDAAREVARAGNVLRRWLH